MQLLRPLACALAVAALSLSAACRPADTGVRIEPRAAVEPAATTAVQRTGLPPAPAASVPPAPRSEATVPSSQPVARVSTPATAATHVPNPAADARILAAILDALGPDADHYSVVVHRLRDGRGAVWRPDEVYYAASLFKLELLYEALHQRSRGALDFRDGITVTWRDIAEDLGTLGRLGVSEGDAISIEDAVESMVTVSDNTTAVMMLYRLGPSQVDATLRILGLRDSSVNTTDLPTSARDMALLMQALVSGNGLGAKERVDGLAVLARQETRYGIPALLPESVRVGNKTGTWPGATHDVAYVDAPNGTYVIAVLSDLGWVWDPIARVGRAVYDAMLREP